MGRAAHVQDSLCSVQPKRHRKSGLVRFQFFFSVQDLWECTPEKSCVVCVRHQLASAGVTSESDMPDIAALNGDIASRISDSTVLI